MISKKTEPEPFHKPRTTEVIQSLSCEPQWLLLLSGRKKPYEHILQDMNALFLRMDKEEDWDFSVKNLSTILDVKLPVFTKWIHLIYDDIFIINRQEPTLFSSEGKRYDLSFSGEYGQVYFYLWLDSTLQLYDTFRFPFLQAKCGFPYFYIKKISHVFYSGSLQTSAYLDYSSPNKYRDFLHEKAKFYGKIRFFEDFSSNHDLDKRLKEIYPS